MIRYKNEVFLSNQKIDEFLDEINLSAKDICNSLIRYYYLKGSVLCIEEDITTAKTFSGIVDSFYKTHNKKTDYSNGIYNLNLKDWPSEYYIDGFITNFSHGDTDRNQYIIAFQPTDYCSVKGLLWPYNKHEDRFLVLNDSVGFNETIQTEFKIAKTTQRLSIRKKYDVLKAGQPDDDKTTLLEEISLDEGLWYNNAHYNRCLVDEFLSKNNSNKGFTRFYKFSDVKTKIREYGIRFNSDTKYNTEKILDKLVNSQDEKTEFEKLIEWFSSTNQGKYKNILLLILTKYSEEYSVKSIPEFTVIKSFIFDFEKNLPYEIKVEEDNGKEIIKLFHLGKPVATFEQLQRTYNIQINSFSRK